MAGTTVIDTARALFDAFNKRDFRIWEDATADTLVANYPSAPHMNKDTARGYNLIFFNACPASNFEVHDSFVNGSKAVFVATVHAVLSQPLMTPAGTIEPTGKSMSAPFILTAEVENGKIVREQVVWNEKEVFSAWGIGG